MKSGDCFYNYSLEELMNAHHIILRSNYRLLLCMTLLFLTGATYAQQRALNRTTALNILKNHPASTVKGYLPTTNIAYTGGVHPDYDQWVKRFIAERIIVCSSVVRSGGQTSVKDCRPGPNFKESSSNDFIVGRVVVQEITGITQVRDNVYQANASYRFEETSAFFNQYREFFETYTGIVDYRALDDIVEGEMAAYFRLYDDGWRFENMHWLSSRKRPRRRSVNDQMIPDSPFGNAGSTPVSPERRSGAPANTPASTPPPTPAKPAWLGNAPQALIGRYTPAPEFQDKRDIIISLELKQDGQMVLVRNKATEKGYYKVENETIYLAQSIDVLEIPSRSVFFKIAPKKELKIVDGNLILKGPKKQEIKLVKDK
jgi:hypothetical protein